MSFSQVLLNWYDAHKRDLPWRTAPSDPYKVWVSEMMLQQTTVSTVIPYFYRFIDRFPSVCHLAAAGLEDIFFLWQGLGYYRRAEYLHKAAQIIVDQGFPETQDEWLALPGIGPYTAAAITAIAFNQPAVAIDGNISRVMSRYRGCEGPQWQNKVAQAATEFLPSDRYGDYTQALMDLGSQICRPKAPLCEYCPLREGCYAFKNGSIENFPPSKKRIKKKRYGSVFIIYRECEGETFIVLTKESPNSLLKGLWGFPTTVWDSVPGPTPNGALENRGTVRHIFTHFDLELNVWAGKDFPLNLDIKGQWVKTSEISTYALSRLMRKVQVFI